MDPRSRTPDEDNPTTELAAALRDQALRELAEIARRRPDAIDGRHLADPASRPS